MAGVSEPEFKETAFADNPYSRPGAAKVKTFSRRNGKNEKGIEPDLELGFPGRRQAWALAFTDFLGAAIAVPIALLLLSFLSDVRTNSLSRFWSNLSIDWLFPVMVLAALAISGFYRSARRSVHPSTFAELKDLSFGIGMGCVLALGAGALAHRVLDAREPPAAQLVTAVVVAIVVIAAGRACLRTLRQAVWGSRIILVGSGELTRQVEAYLKLKRGNSVLGHVVDAKASDTAALKAPGCIGTVTDLPRLCGEYRVERLVVCFPVDESSESIAVLRSLQHRVKLAVVPRFFELISWRSTLTDLYGLPLLEVAAPHLSSWDRMIKRALDLTVAGVTLLVLSPLLAIVAVFVKLTSPGPVLFRQTRIGRGRKAFTIYKFRTMSVQPESVGRHQLGEALRPIEPAQLRLHEIRNKVNDRDRITRLGRILRKTSLDEIPQLVNVLKGHMSLVGPRPFVPHESEDLGGWTAVRFQVRPGITGLWQVSGRNDLSVDDLRRLDYLYVASWSMWWDIKILWDTPRVMARGFGAY